MINFTDLVTRYNDPLQRYLQIQHNIHDNGLRDDLIQNMWLSILRRPLPKVWSFGFLKTVLKRRMLDYFAKKSSHEIKLPHGIKYGNGEENVGDYACHDGLLGDGSYKYLDVIESRSEHPNILSEEVNTALNTLPHRMKRCITSVCIEGYTHQETANRLNIPLGTVLSNVSRGRGKLRHLLSKYKREMETI